MSFNFNQNNSSLTTSTPAKPAAGFGNFSFGGGATNAAPTFGAPSASVAPTFGATGFGATNTGPTLGGFGGLNATSTATSAPTFSGLSGFGASTTTSSAPSIFGTTATAAVPSFGGFGAAPTSTATSFTGFGNQPAANTGFGGFGATATTTSAPAFGGFGTTAAAPSFGGFGSSFGSTFGKPAAAPPAFSGFGTGAFGIGQTQQQQQQLQMQQPQPLTADEAFAQSIFNVSIYGDERDTIIAKWNYLQAMWGTGKSFYSQSACPVDITPQNYLCRLKTIGYSRLPGKDNKYGLVAIIFNKPLSDIKTQQQQLINSLNQIFGTKPNIVINIESLKQIEEKKSQVVIFVEEKSQIPPNETKRVLATDVANYLSQMNVKSQLFNLGVEQVLALVLPDEDQLKEYLENPPKGIDPRMWRQAKIDNPDENKFIPVPLIGFNELKCRIKCQETETETHSLYLGKVEKDLNELKQRHAATTAKILEHKRKLSELSHNILKIVVKQECTRKVGMGLLPEEEALRSKLENMQALVSAPTQFKGRLSELLSQMRMQRNQYASTGGNEYTIDKESEDEMKAFLTMQQKAMEVLIETVNKDMKALQIITEGMPELMKGITPRA